MVVTMNVAIVSLGMRSCSRTIPDVTLYAVWTPLAIVLGLAAFWMGRGFVAWASRPLPREPVWACVGCGPGALQALMRTRPGRPALWVGARCPRCGMTYRRVEGKIVGFPPAIASGPSGDPGIRFESVNDEAETIRFLDDPPA